MPPLETFDKDGNPLYFVQQGTIQALQGLIAKAAGSPGGFAGEVTEAEAKALRELGEAKTKYEF